MYRSHADRQSADEGGVSTLCGAVSTRGVHVFYEAIPIYLICEFYKFGIDTHLCERRDTPTARICPGVVGIVHVFKFF